jgi:hypothetical protein
MYVFQGFGVSRRYGCSVKHPLSSVFDAETLYPFANTSSGIGIAKYASGEIYLYSKI